MIKRWLALAKSFIRSLMKEGISATCSKAERKLFPGIESMLPFTWERQTTQELTSVPSNIKFSILVSLCNTPKNQLREMICSIQMQTYTNWELCIADSSDFCHAYIRQICSEYAKSDSQIKYRSVRTGVELANQSNVCIDMATGEYCALLQQGDILYPTALHAVVKEIYGVNADFIYTDECYFHDKAKKPYRYSYKPSYAPDNLRGRQLHSQSYGI